MELNRLFEQNRFWEERNVLLEDAHIRAIEDSPLEIVNPVEHKIRLDEDRVYILRGPRQVGKTTLLKKLVKRLIFERGVEPRRVFYFAFDIGGIRDDKEVFDLLKTYLSWVRRETRERLWIFLDEVTYTPQWSTGIKAAFDLGLLKRVTLVNTGSSSIDLKRGGERLPGRRGKGAEENDLTILPLSFRAFLQVIYPQLQLPTLPSFSLNDIYNTTSEISLYGDKIKEAFELYLLTGGYPLPLIYFRRNQKIEESVFYTYLQAILGDLVKLGKRELYVREIIYLLISKWFEPVNWEIISQLTTIRSHNTVSEYIEILELMYVLKVIHQVRTLGGGEISFRKRKKVYFLDPFTYHTLRAWSIGTGESYRTATLLLNDPERRAKIVEGIVCTHLTPFFSSVAFWRDRGEIDFICLKKRRPEVYIEVKYQPQIVSDDKKSLKKVGGGLILSKDQIIQDIGNNIIVTPVPYFLASLPSVY